jgi:hypothetical protein
MNNDQLKAFIKILSRYVEVSHVFFKSFEKEKKFIENPTVEDRHSRLFNLLNELSIKKQTGIAPMDERNSTGQNVVPTPENFEQTKIYQDIVKEFLNDENNLNQYELKNKRKILDLLKATPEEFLGSFPSVSYAWDILTELACLSFLPSQEKLTSRNLIHMHSVELIEHLSRLFIQITKMSLNDEEINLSGIFTIRELEDFKNENTLVEKILGSSSKRTVRKLVDKFCSMLDKEEKIKAIIAPLIEPILVRLTQVENGFPDMLEEDISIKEAEYICNEIVSFGIVIGYTTWLFFAKEEQISRGMLIKHCLFCTRYLLDEQRWEVCKNVSNVCKEIIYSINQHTKEKDIHNKAYMVEANNFFARKMLKENIQSDVEVWDVNKDNVHNKFKFLQKILLGTIDGDTNKLARELLMPENNGKPNMSIHEFCDWPILESFRRSQYWADFECYAKGLATN